MQGELQVGSAIDGGARNETFTRNHDFPVGCAETETGNTI
jgi:hypothetical protein